MFTPAPFAKAPTALSRRETLRLRRVCEADISRCAAVRASGAFYIMNKASYDIINNSNKAHKATCPSRFAASFALWALPITVILARGQRVPPPNRLRPPGAVLPVKPSPPTRTAVSFLSLPASFSPLSCYGSPDKEAVPSVLLPLPDCLQDTDP